MRRCYGIRFSSGLSRMVASTVGEVISKAAKAAASGSGGGGSKKRSKAKKSEKGLVALLAKAQRKANQDADGMRPTLAVCLSD